MGESNREEILARYRRLRTISERHHSGAIDFLALPTVVDQARRIGLAVGRTLVAETLDELTLAVDLAVYTAPPGRSRAIDRYARWRPPEPGSDEALMLDAMRRDRFSLFNVKRRHETCGLILLDILGEKETWVVDQGLERTAPEGMTFAMRTFVPESFTITAGVIVPMGLLMMEQVLEEIVPVCGPNRDKIAGDRRFAAAIYRAAVDEGVMERVSFERPDASAA